MQAQQDKTTPSRDRIIQDLQQQIDELKTENLLLREQIARKEQFTAMIAHDLRAPLAPILNYAQLLARQSHSPSDSEATIEKKNAAIQRQTSIIISQAHRMNRQVNDLLDISHLSINQFTLICTQHDLVALVKEIVEQVRPVAPYHTIVLKAPETPLIGNWDADRLQQALGNLLDNAIKYSGEGTTITITISTTEQLAQVSVHNQGADIPSSDIGLLFRPYTRLESSQHRHGTGLGLFITKSIIEAHDGTLRLEPRNEDSNSEYARGITFTFELPLAG